MIIIVIVSVYLTLIRHSNLSFKEKGFYCNNGYILYEYIKIINLSKIGILIVYLINKTFSVKWFLDLDKMYNLMINLNDK
ncbi:MAG: DUF986 family protein [Arsenophonus sp. NC-PE1-MAG3]